mmetsp:Transcript_10792/g.25475  ORF Transcript_10792/g.25475 Transcript_10792/m.25475 type:complete len:357 (+) Transcript_10792:522-1592(+)
MNAFDGQPALLVDALDDGKDGPEDVAADNVAIGVHSGDGHLDVPDGALGGRWGDENSERPQDVGPEQILELGPIDHTCNLAHPSTEVHWGLHLLTKSKLVRHLGEHLAIERHDGRRNLATPPLVAGRHGLGPREGGRQRWRNKCAGLLLSMLELLVLARRKHDGILVGDRHAGDIILDGRRRRHRPDDPLVLIDEVAEAQAARGTRRRVVGRDPCLDAGAAKVVIAPRRRNRRAGRPGGRCGRARPRRNHRRLGGRVRRGRSGHSDPTPGARSTGTGRVEEILEAEAASGVLGRRRELAPLAIRGGAQQLLEPLQLVDRHNVVRRGVAGGGGRRLVHRCRPGPPLRPVRADVPVLP